MVDEKAPMSKEQALEMSILLGLLSTTGVDKEDRPKYQKALVGTFNGMLEGLGYTVVAKES